MRGAGNVLITLLVLAVFMMAAYLVFTVPQSKVIVQQQPAAPTTPVKETVTHKVWSLMVVLQDTEQKPVYDANVYLLFEKPANIYKTPTTGIYMSATDVNISTTFENVLTGRTYFVLAEAPGYYNNGVEVNMPTEYPAGDDSPYTVTITMTHKGDIIGFQVPLTYRGSTADIAKLIYDEAADAYKTEFQAVVSNDGEVRIEKVMLELNTTNLGTATIDNMTVKVGDQEYTFENVTGNKTIKFEEPLVIPAGSTLTIDMTLSGTGLDAVSGELFKVHFYDVQSGEWIETVEGPA